jgi:CheY-like chemotaxis protein
MPKRVLLVDDHASVRKALRDLFERSGYDCAEAENGIAAVDASEQFNPDVIVLDFSMPVMNGLEATPLFRKKFPQTPIIMFTMFANEAFSKAAIAAGVSAVVSKEHASTQLVPKAESLLKST